MKFGDATLTAASPVTPKQFLGAFFSAGDTLCLRIFADRKDQPFTGMKLRTALETFDSLLPQLQAHNDRNRGIFFVVNAGGQTDREITRINAQFVESDDLPLDEQWVQIVAFPLEPSIVVRTRKSLHTYWLMKDAKVEDFRRIQRKLIACFHGDPACVNESRVLRLPGFKHCKQEPVMVECVKFDPELRYTQAQLEACLPDIEVPEPIEAPKPLQGGLDRVLDGCDFLRYCRENATTLPEHDWYAMISNLAVFQGGETAIQCERCISTFGFLAKNSQGNAIISPYITIAQAYMKQANNLWSMIYSIVRENCSTEYSGKTPQDDVMERLLSMRRN